MKAKEIKKHHDIIRILLQIKRFDYVLVYIIVSVFPQA